MINSKLLSDLHPRVQKIAEKFIQHCKLHGIDVIITSTFRDYESQDALYAKGRTTEGPKVTKAKGGESFHNFRVAFDCVPVEHGKAIWDNEGLWKEIGEIGVSLGLEWGGNFKSFKDKPHFQFTNGLALKDFQQGKMV